ncbi:MAG: endonuclease domain-containing protein [Bacteroidetes bacterium]|nr:endonuclease domain-containing protein [Bacteroidota bacterium]
MKLTTKYSMFYGATPEIFENARILRNNQTSAEKKLWEYIKNNQLGKKFRRQHSISSYIVDFYCHMVKLVIEVDGEYHNDSEQTEYDSYRATDLKEFGLRIIRFTNDQVFNDIDFVISEIKKFL